VKILFVMQHSGFVFYYESTLRLLAERGHTIVVAYERAQESDQLTRLCASEPRISHEPLPRRKGDRRLAFATGVRTFQDYLRYLHPRYARATYLRRRVEEKVHPALLALGRAVRATGTFGVNVLQAALRAIERCTPVPPAVTTFVRDRAPDVVLVTPLIDIGSKQVDYLKAARRLRISSGACIASWDNLTNKGLMRVTPDQVFVWNDIQRDEAVALHRVRRDRVVVTGAQAFDHWFDWKPSMPREEFCRAVGLDPREPYVLFVGSTVGIAAEEPAYVANWIRALRASGHAGFDRLGVLVRPHPKQWARWQSVDLSGTGNTAIQHAQAPVDAASRSSYFDALFHGAAVVGVNTSAMIEAAIVGRPVYTLLAPEFEETQEGTLHFHYLSDAKGGPLHVARTLEDHFAQLAEGFRAAATSDVSGRFVRSFVRPHGLSIPAAPLLADAIEALGRAPHVEPSSNHSPATAVPR
jgi:hypothetical protein